MERENGRAGAQDVFDSERGGSCGGGLRLQALQEADKHLQIPDHPEEKQKQVREEEAERRETVLGYVLNTCLWLECVPGISLIYDLPSMRLGTS